MSVKTISKDELRRMEGSEGLIIQGCGGSLDEWVDGINDMLTEDGILLDGTRFHDCSTFEHDGSTCLLFPFKDDVIPRRTLPSRALKQRTEKTFTTSPWATSRSDNIR